jgi:hypothetical protein
MGWLVKCLDTACGWKAADEEESQAKHSKIMHETANPLHHTVIQWVHPPDETVVIGGGRGLVRSGKRQIA